jgi:hypothetical protein
VAELSEEELDDLVEQAIVDAYGDDEQLTAFCTLIEDNLALPFTTIVLDLPLPEPAPSGSEWIAAFRHWAGGQ